MPEIITLDGPAASGKSTLGDKLSEAIGFQFIDSGIFYRAGCWAVLKKGIALNSGEIDKAFNSFTLIYSPERGKNQVSWFGQEITPFLHDPEISKLVPYLSSQESIRFMVRDIQRRVAGERDTIMAGRDIGTEIFPGAKIKFFVTAAPEVRAKRRAAQSGTDYKMILEDILKRDEMDSTRDISPMRVPNGAFVLDTSNLSIEQSVMQMREHYLTVFAA